MDDIGPGDVVVNVCSVNAPLGAVRRVSGLCHDESHENETGILLQGHAYEDDHFCRCFDPANWRKLNDGEGNATVLARIKSCRAKTPCPA